MTITKKLLFSVAFAGMFVAAVSAQGAEGYDDSKVNEALRQLGRGLGNVAFGALEIPANIMEVQREDGEVAGITYGTVRGIYRCCVREFVGIFEILTFPARFEPIVNPEFPAEKGIAGTIVESEKPIAIYTRPEWEVKPLKRIERD